MEQQKECKACVNLYIVLHWTNNSASDKPAKPHTKRETRFSSTLSLTFTALKKDSYAIQSYHLQD